MPPLLLGELHYKGETIMHSLKKFVSFIDRFNDRIGKIVSLIIFPIIFILVYEVFMRYFLNRPTFWVHELSGMLYAIFFIIGGLYDLLWNNHINVDIFYSKFSKKGQAIIDLFTYILFYIFIFVMFWGSLETSYISVQRLEISHTAWGPPIWPIKAFIPLASFLMLLQGLSKTIKDIYFVFTGKDFIRNYGGEK